MAGHEQELPAHSAGNPFGSPESGQGIPGLPRIPGVGRPAHSAGNPFGSPESGQGLPEPPRIPGVGRPDPSFWWRVKHYAGAVWAENIKEWKLELTYKADFARTLIDPVIYLLPYLFYGLALVGGRQSQALQRLTGTSDLVTFVTLGYVFIGFLNMALWAMGFSLRKEQFYGTLESVFAAPVPRWVFTLGMSAHSILHQILMIAVQLVFIAAVFSISINPAGLLPSLAIIGLMLIALYGIGMIMASATLIFKQGWLVSEALGSILLVVTPIAYPLAVLPLFMQKVAMAVPTTYGILAVRHFLLGEQVSFSVGAVFVRVAVLCVVWVAFGLVVFTLIDRYTRRSGTLSHY